jgi:hypothetical protein
VKNPLRNFVEKELPAIDLSKFSARPNDCINLSIGDPTISLSFRYLRPNAGPTKRTCTPSPKT